MLQATSMTCNFKPAAQKSFQNHKKSEPFEIHLSCIKYNYGQNHR